MAYTAQEIAWITHTPGKELAKTVMVKIDDVLAMAVLPASFHVDLARLKAIAGASSAAVATEREFRSQFPDCETGAMPPFGNLYGMTVYADQSLAADKEIAFNAGTHRELIRISYADFTRLASPMPATSRLDRGGCDSLTRDPLADGFIQPAKVTECNVDFGLRAYVIARSP